MASIEQPAKSKRAAWGIALFLLLVTTAVYLPVLGHDFISFDDRDYVLENPHVRSGLSFANVGLAFLGFHSGNWHPLTWLSHMLDCQLYGLKAWGHHLTSVLLHVTNTLLLFLVLKRFTGVIWQSACVAALFAWHPLHVESVAWVAERKDVLSASFFMLTLWAYVKYVVSKHCPEPVPRVVPLNPREERDPSPLPSPLRKGRGRIADSPSAKGGSRGE